MNRNIKELKRIINTLPSFGIEDKETLLIDLSLQENSLSDAGENSKVDEIKSFVKSRLHLIEQAKEIVTTGSFNEGNLMLIRELYTPIFSEEIVLVPVTLNLHPSLIQDLDEVRKAHPYCEKYDLENFIELLLIEKVVEHSRNKGRGNKISDYFKRILPALLFSR
ncbi:hypothetical protein [Paenibacillus sp. SN-8-1]|uniref:hypothetical protein n=1 Tax=Paenibacillus sp. SN-8-1 TaxID=3435409 RepID=UPI003D9A0E56